MSIDKTIFIFLFALLTLMVKEDAAIYVFSIALWIFIARQKRWTGFAIAVIAVVYFFIANAVVAWLGEGVMMWRLGTYIPGGQGGFIDVIKTVFFNFGFLVSQVFTHDGDKKIIFILWVFGPLLFTPFLTGKKSELVLLIPMLVINVMLDWSYQYNIDYQYTFGSVALAFVIALFSIVRMNLQIQRTVMLTCLSVALLFTISLNIGKIQRNHNYFFNNIERFRAASTVLEAIEPEASVTTSTFIAPHLYKHTVVYDSHYFHIYTPQSDGQLIDGLYPLTDYLVIDPNARNAEEIIETYKKAGYTLEATGGFIEVYKKTLDI